MDCYSNQRPEQRCLANEFPLAEPNRLHVLRAGDGTTIESLAKDSPIKQYPLQQLRLINSLYPDGEPKPGDLVKTVK